MQEHADLYSDLEKLGVKIDKIKALSPTEKQLHDLRDGLSKLRSSTLQSVP